MPLRSNAFAHFESAGANAALRLPLSGNSSRTAGENLQAPRLSERAKDGGGRATAELDDLFSAAQTLGGIGGEPEMPARLRPERSRVAARSQGAGQAAFDDMRTSGTFCSAIAPPQDFV